MNSTAQPSPITPDRRFLRPFKGEAMQTPPIWLMRQAGRYLPEYLEVRSQAGNFLNLCYTPRLAAEVTLQPIRRYGFDAAILFSDILIVPDALGQTVGFFEGEGPRLDPIGSAAQLSALEPSKAHLKYEIIFESVERIRAGLPDDTALIGFCGAPWTVATYMVGGSTSKDQAETRLFANRDPEGFGQLIDILVETSIEYLDGQVKAGADALQIFDSWAGSLPDDQFGRWVVEPTRKMVTELKKRHPDVPILGFPRGADALAQTFALETGVDGVSCDTAMPLEFIKEQLSGRTVVQGNLDPLLLVTGGAALDRRVNKIIETLGPNPFIFNLGHGIIPQTPPENVARLVKLVRGEV